MTQTKTRPENYWFSNFICHMKPIGEKNTHKKFQAISLKNDQVMVILIFGPQSTTTLVKIENLPQKPQKWTKFNEISYTLSLYGKK